MITIVNSLMGFLLVFFTVYAYAFPCTENVQNWNLTVYKIVCFYFVFCNNILSIFLRINSFLRVGGKSLISRLRVGWEIEAESPWPRWSSSKAASAGSAHSALVSWAAMFHLFSSKPIFCCCCWLFLRLKQHTFIPLGAWQHPVLLSHREFSTLH